MQPAPANVNQQANKAETERERAKKKRNGATEGETTQHGQKQSRQIGPRPEGVESVTKIDTNRLLFPKERHAQNKIQKTHMHSHSRSINHWFYHRRLGIALLPMATHTHHIVNTQSSHRKHKLKTRQTLDTREKGSGSLRPPPRFKTNQKVEIRSAPLLAQQMHINLHSLRKIALISLTQREAYVHLMAVSHLSKKGVYRDPYVSPLLLPFKRSVGKKEPQQMRNCLTRKRPVGALLFFRNPSRYKLPCVLQKAPKTGS